MVSKDFSRLLKNVDLGATPKPTRGRSRPQEGVQVTLRCSSGDCLLQSWDLTQGSWQLESGGVAVLRAGLPVPRMVPHRGAGQGYLGESQPGRRTQQRQAPSPGCFRGGHTTVSRCTVLTSESCLD